MRRGGSLAALSPTPIAPVAVHAAHNPILSDGRYYSTDPAPLVVGDTLYILTGRDEAAPGVNDFIMNEWQMLSTRDVASGDWAFYPAMLRPEKVFAWAAPARAYAGQIVQGGDKRFYLYAPVLRDHCEDKDCFGIGVAVSDTPLGPWVDAHPQGPIISQAGPVRNTMQNIDPTPFVDDDGRVYIYWGTFGQLRGMELERDMVTPKGEPVTVTSLKGFFEAPWLFKRKGTYYLAYAGNDVKQGDGCTPAVYHACIAYGTAPSPLGPWTYTGVVLPPVSSTTSHPGFAAFKGKWYITYHTADAKRGDHFRRSVAIDELHWDDSVSPARMRMVQPTPRPVVDLPPQRNIAPAARASASTSRCRCNIGCVRSMTGLCATRLCRPTCGAPGPGTIPPAHGCNMAGLRRCGSMVRGSPSFTTSPPGRAWGWHLHAPGIWSIGTRACGRALPHAIRWRKRALAMCLSRLSPPPACARSSMLPAGMSMQALACRNGRC
jgi:hypothetical protein